MTCICEAMYFNFMYTWMYIVYTRILNLRIMSFCELLQFGFTNIYLFYALESKLKKKQFSG